MKNKKIIWSKADICKNVLYVTIDFKIYMYIESEQRHRLLGKINNSKREITVIRKESHRHYKSDSYGFNETMLNEANICQYIKLKSSEGIFRLPIYFIKQNGFYLHFKNQGFEKQIFLKVDSIKQFKVSK